MSENLLLYIDRLLNNNKSEVAIDCVNKYFDIFIMIMIQVTYLRKGVCNTKYQIKERLSDRDQFKGPSIERFNPYYENLPVELSYASIDVICVFNSFISHKTLDYADKTLGDAEIDLEDSVTKMIDSLKIYDLLAGVLEDQPINFINRADKLGKMLLMYDEFKDYKKFSKDIDIFLSDIMASGEWIL